MSGKDRMSSDVELASLVNSGHSYDDDADADADDDSMSPFNEDNIIYPGRATRPLGSGSERSGYAGKDVLIFLLSVISGILLVTLLLSKTSDSSISAASGEDSNESPVITPWTSMRWKPVASANGATGNCYPGFRLANATLHCGIKDASPLTKDHAGTHYCGGVELEPNSCILPTEGRWEAPSQNRAQKGVYSKYWFEGRDRTIPPLHGRFGVNSKNSMLPRCKTMDQLIDGGLGEDGEWVPNTCSAIPLSPFVLTENAKCQTTITMMGDSHIRNVFSATVYGLRGIESFVEEHSSDAKVGGVVRSYEWRLKDGVATDRALVHANTNLKEPTPFEDCPCDEVQRCLRIAFIWAPSFNEQLHKMNWATKWQSDLIIVEPGNSYEGSVALSSDWTAKFDELLEQNQNLHLSMLHFPWGKQPAERPAALTEWVGNGTYADRMSYLPQNAILQEDNKQSGATWHFACSLEKVDVENDLINAVKPCTDITDTAQIRAIVTVHFAAFVNESGSL